MRSQRMADSMNDAPAWGWPRPRLENRDGPEEPSCNAKPRSLSALEVGRETCTGGCSTGRWTWRNPLHWSRAETKRAWTAVGEAISVRGESDPETTGELCSIQHAEDQRREAHEPAKRPSERYGRDARVMHVAGVVATPPAVLVARATPGAPPDGRGGIHRRALPGAAAAAIRPRSAASGHAGRSATCVDPGQTGARGRVPVDGARLPEPLVAADARGACDASAVLARGPCVATAVERRCIHLRLGV